MTDQDVSFESGPEPVSEVIQEAQKHYTGQLYDLFFALLLLRRGCNLWPTGSANRSARRFVYCGFA